MFHLTDISWGTRDVVVQSNDSVNERYSIQLSSSNECFNNNGNGNTLNDQLMNSLINQNDNEIDNQNRINELQKKLQQTQHHFIIFFGIMSIIGFGLSFGLMIIDYFIPFTILGISFSFLSIPTIFIIGLLCIQFICMIIHRCSSLQYLLSHI